MPRRAVITGEGNEEAANVAAVEDVVVVPGYVHSPVEGRRWVVVRPTRLSVVTPAVVDTDNGSNYRIPAESWSYTRPRPNRRTRIDDPDGEPVAALTVVKNDRVTQVRDGATNGVGVETGEGQAAVGGDRCARDVDRIGTHAS